MSASRSTKPAAGSLVWAQGLACGGVLAFAPALAVLLAALLWPVVAAFAKDHAHRRPGARSVALCAGAASVGPIHSAWLGGFGLDVVLRLATDWRVLAAAWCAAAAGWLLADLAPLATRAGLETLAKSRAARLRAEQARLRALWGWEESADPEL
jgi:MFS family permease